MRVTKPSIPAKMEHWSKTSVYEPQPIGKHKPRDVAGAGSGKVMKLLNVFPLPRKQPGGFSGGVETKPEGKLKRDRDDDDAGFPRGGSGKFLKTANGSPAIPRGFSSGGGEMRHPSNVKRGESSTSWRDWPENADHRRRSVAAISPKPSEGTLLVKTQPRIPVKPEQRTSLVKTQPRIPVKPEQRTSLVKTEPRNSLGKPEPRMSVNTGQRTSLVKTGKVRTEVKQMDVENTQRTEETKWMQAREAVMERLMKFRSFYKELEEEKMRGKTIKRRLDCLAYEMLKECYPRDFPKKPVIGAVPGIEVGQKFEYRLEMRIVGLHRPTQSGIDTMVDPETGYNVAISVVECGRYDNYMSSPETLIYCAQGYAIENQKYKAVNQAMIKSIKAKTPVRVIRSRKVHNYLNYFYDGLYKVEGMWEDKNLDGNNLKFKLVKIPGQPSSLLKNKPRA